MNLRLYSDREATGSASGLIGHCFFSSLSRASAAKLLRCDGTYDHFLANVLLGVPFKEC